LLLFIAKKMASKRGKAAAHDAFFNGSTCGVHGILDASLPAYSSVIV